MPVTRATMSNSHDGLTIVIYDQTIYGGLGFDIISTGFGADTIFGDRPGDGDGVHR